MLLSLGLSNQIRYFINFYESKRYNIPEERTMRNKNYPYTVQKDESPHV